MAWIISTKDMLTLISRSESKPEIKPSFNSPPLFIIKQVLRLDHWSETSHPFRQIMTDRPTNQPTDRPVHREVSLPITNPCWIQLILLNEIPMLNSGSTTKFIELSEQDMVAGQNNSDKSDKYFLFIGVYYQPFSLNAAALRTCSMSKTVSSHLRPPDFQWE